MGFYDDMQQIASSILGDFKQGVVKLHHYTSSNGGSLDEPADKKDTVYTLNATIDGVSYKYLLDNFAAASDITVTAAVIKGVKIGLDDFVEINGEQYKILRDVSPAPTAVNGQPIVWRLICRKG